jgi:hypothetical protein
MRPPLKKARLKEGTRSIPVRVYATPALRSLLRRAATRKPERSLSRFMALAGEALARFPELRQAFPVRQPVSKLSSRSNIYVLLRPEKRNKILQSLNGRWLSRWMVEAGLIFAAHEQEIERLSESATRQTLRSRRRLRDGLNPGLAAGSESLRSLNIREVNSDE